jgi:hypothetical protein
MANSKISALTSATTPLAGTETVPIVQGGATVKATVANITGAGAYAGSFTSLAYTTTLTGGTGIVNLGSGQFYKDASGNVTIGTTSTPTSKFGVNGSSIFSTGGNVLNAGGGVYFAANGVQLNPMSGIKGVLINNASGEDQGGLSFQTRPNGAAGQVLTERMRISAAGDVGIGVTSPAVKLDVLGTIQTAAAATQDAVRLAGRAGGTGTFAVTLTPTTLTASRTLTLPDATTTVVGTDATQTLTNKWVQPRVLASTANSATPTLNTDNYDMMVITGQTVAITSFTTNLTGTPVNGQKLIIAITGTGAIGLTWGASFEASTVALPTTTVTTNRLDVGFIWNVATTKWRCVAVA